MLVKLLGVSLAALAVAEKTHNVTVECVDDNDITISIAYDRPRVEVLNFLAGSCNKTGDIEWSQNNKTNAVDIKMSMRDCGLRSNDRSRVTRALRTIFFDNIATFTLGRRDDGRDMVFYENKVNVTCAVKDTYSVQVGYGPINADFTKADGLDGGEKVYNFAMRSVDADFNATVVPSSRAGDTVQLVVDSSDVDFLLYKFAVTSCVFEETNKNTVVTSYKLFDYTANDCKNEFLDFTIGYCNATNAFKITHTVFTFDPTNENNYTLTCNIKLCDFDVTKSVDVCNNMEKACRIPRIQPVIPVIPWDTQSEMTVKESDCKWAGNATDKTIKSNCTWSPMVKCPRGSYVCGLQAKTEGQKQTGGDNTGVTGMKAKCCEPGQVTVGEVLIHDDPRGYWGFMVACDNDELVCETTARFESNKGENEDDTGLTGLKGACCKPDGGPGVNVRFENGLWGDWVTKIKCPSEMRVCGMAMQNHPDQGDGWKGAADDTGANGIKIQCCNI